MVQKSIVLDFDHTIGYFTQMVFIINTIEVTHHMELSESDFHILFHHYPHIFRPKLLDILQLVLHLQKDNKVIFFILYTRNNLQRFVEAIVSYLESKLKHHELFQFKIYEKTNECEKLYKICREQDDTISLQSSAIAKQTLYINLLNSKDYKNPIYSPVH